MKRVSEGADQGEQTGQPTLHPATFAIHDSDEDDSDAAGDLSKLLAR